MKRNLLAVIVIAAACASSEETVTTTPTPQPAAAKPAAVVVDPVGTYEFSTLVDGQTVTGTLTIAGTPGAYTGRIVTNMFPEIPITAARVEDKTVIATGSMPDGELTLRMLMDGMNFTGNWQLGEDSGEFNGKKLPK